MPGRVCRAVEAAAATVGPGTPDGGQSNSSDARLGNTIDTGSSKAGGQAPQPEEQQPQPVAPEACTNEGLRRCHMDTNITENIARRSRTAPALPAIAAAPPRLLAWRMRVLIVRCLSLSSARWRSWTTRVESPAARLPAGLHDLLRLRGRRTGNADAAVRVGRQVGACCFAVHWKR